MAHSKFVHLHLHTQYSLLDGAIRHEELFNLAKGYKMNAVSMTDHGNIFGAIEFYKSAMKHGLKPIIGCEVYVSHGKMTEKTARQKGSEEGGIYHLILLVKNIKGYHNLCKLLTKAYLEGFYYKPRVDKELLQEFNEGLIALSACLRGEVPSLILSGAKERAVAAARHYSEIFTNRRFFLEIQDNGIEEQKKVNEGLIEISKELSLPLVATNDCHYLKKEDARSHEILLCIQTGKTMNSPDRMRFATDEFYFKSPDEMIERFKDVPTAIENTLEIADRCNLELTFGEYHLPEFHLPEGETVDSLLDRLSIEGLEKRFLEMEDVSGTPVDKWHYYERLKKELNVIKKMGFSGYFLIVNDFIEYARKEKIPVGPGRGSAAGSLAAYALRITELDPIRYNLLFERFLNPDRISLPDIDIDFCFEGRDRVIRYVTKKYGINNVAQIITFGQMKAKAVIRDVGRALDMPYAEVDKIAKLVPNAVDMTIEKALDAEPKLKELIKGEAKVKELIVAARTLEGLPRHASTHAAGVVISKKPLEEYLPLYKGKEDVITTQFAMKDVETIGLVKFDFLGIKTLTMIDKAIKEIMRNKKIEINIELIPLDDKDAFNLISEGRTNGVFQLESSGMKELLRKLKPETFEDLMAAVALYRPGPLQSGMVDDFIKRKHGETRITYELAELKDILENTYGVMVYQEQVMEIAKVLAGYTPGDADVLRKAMGKKVHEVMLDEREKFLKGAKERKIPEKKAEKIFDLMAHFAGYGFNKSHSAAYALIAYQTAYLKAHYPVEFMAALLSINMQDSDKARRYIGECRSMGIGVLPPDLNESNMDFSVIGNDIRFALAAIKNVGEAAIEAILKARDKAFTDFKDFLSRVDSRKVNKKVVEMLIKCGAFDFTRISRAKLISIFEGGAENRNQQTIFEMLPSSAVNVGIEPSFKEWTEKEKLSYERSALGFYITAHPLTEYLKELKLYATDTIETIKEKNGSLEMSVVGIVTELRETITKKGSKMAFVRFEDLTGEIEVVVFSDAYAKCETALKNEDALIITGRIEKEGAGGIKSEEEKEQSKIIATEIITLDDAKKKRPKKTHIFTPTERVDKETFPRLKEIFKKHPGKSPVVLHLLYPDEKEIVVGLSEELKIEPTEDVLHKIKEIIEGTEVRFSL